MTLHTKLMTWGIGVVAAALVVLVILASCRKGGEAPPDGQADVKIDNDGRSIPAQTTSLSQASKFSSFKDAVILSPALEGELQPPDTTYTGKNAIKIFETISTSMWDQVAFVDNAGKPIRYQAVLKTELGDIHFDLLGDQAPNHVRNFVCLAKAGYYDGMGFYYSVRRKVEDTTIAFIEAGCPRGTGEVGSGSIGYWLKRELNEKISHDAGIVGACIGVDPDSAACRFYITVAPNPFMDGRFTAFGRVTKGMDIVQAINKRAVTEFDRLDRPVGIRSVEILSNVE